MSKTGIKIAYSGNLSRSHNFSWNKFHDLEEIEAFIDYLHSTYSSIISLVHIGNSYEGRKMRVVRLCSSGRCGTKTAIWVDAGTHAREWLSISSITYLMNELVKDSSLSIIKNLDWYFLPVVNPDGYVYSRKYNSYWRKTRSKINNSACIGVDPNRNFPFKWSKMAGTECSNSYPGPEPFSEIEVRNMRDFILPRKNKIKEFTTIHSYGEMALYPWAYVKDPPPTNLEYIKVGMAGVVAIHKIRDRFYNLGSVANEIPYLAPGSAIDYFYGVVGIPFTFVVEAGQAFHPDNNEILPVAREFHAFQVTVAKQILMRYPK